MSIIITMQNPHNPLKPTRLVSNSYESLDEVVAAIWFFMEYCRIVSVEIAGES